MEKNKGVLDDIEEELMEEILKSGREGKDTVEIPVIKAMYIHGLIHGVKNMIKTIDRGEE